MTMLVPWQHRRLFGCADFPVNWKLVVLIKIKIKVPKAPGGLWPCLSLVFRVGAISGAV
jgi:hypothetical protein